MSTSTPPTNSTLPPSVTLSLANHDNNQHAEDGNLRLGNLWDAIDVAAAVMTMDEGRWASSPSPCRGEGRGEGSE